MTKIPQSFYHKKTRVWKNSCFPQTILDRCQIQFSTVTFNFKLQLSIFGWIVKGAPHFLLSQIQLPYISQYMMNIPVRLLLGIDIFELMIIVIIFFFIMENWIAFPRRRFCKESVNYLMHKCKQCNMTCKKCYCKCHDIPQKKPPHTEHGSSCRYSINISWLMIMLLLVLLFFWHTKKVNNINYAMIMCSNINTI